jgi:hypothetical protein
LRLAALGADVEQWMQSLQLPEKFIIDRAPTAIGGSFTVL